MLKDREIHAEKFDDGLLIPEDFETKLEAEAVGFTPPPPATSEPETPVHHREVQMPPPSAAGATSDHSAEVYQLQKNLATVLKENKTLKDEVKLLRGKLEQIKKIA
jgi:hypothetical protein